MTESNEISDARIKLKMVSGKWEHEKRMEATTPEMEKQMREVLEEICGYNLDEFNKSWVVAWSSRLSSPDGMGWFRTFIDRHMTGEVYINEDADPDAEPR